MKKNTDYDVIIIGTGLGGNVLASILSKNGIQVLMIDSNSHPKFAIGESTIPLTSYMVGMLAEKYGIPELNKISIRPEEPQRHEFPTCGTKEIFGFVYHNRDKEHNVNEGLQFGSEIRSEYHQFRQDVDAYLLHTAIKYGADVLQDTKIEAVYLKDDCVEMQIATQKKVYTAKYIVDGSGYNSIFAKQLDLRQNPTPLAHHSRSLFTHMIDVKPFEDCVDTPFTRGWSKGTLHHVFKGGWFWVIPFNNHKESINPLVSVGLTIDPRVYPKDDSISPETEFRNFIEYFPSVKRQFKNAKAVRPWVSTGRLQYSSKHTAGKRYCLLAHAGGFIDPLFSQGMAHTFGLINHLSSQLIRAHHSNDYLLVDAEKLNTFNTAALHGNDKIVRGSFISWDNFKLWNLWFRIWALTVLDIETNLLNKYLYARRTGDYMPIEECMNKEPYYSDYESKGFKHFLTSVWEKTLEYEKNPSKLQECIEYIQEKISQFDAKVHSAPSYKSDAFIWALKNPESRDLFDCVKHNKLWFNKQL